MLGVVLVLGHTLHSQTQSIALWTFYNKTYQPNNIVAVPLFAIPELGSAGDSLKNTSAPGSDNPINGPISVSASFNNVRYNAEMVPGQADKGLMFGVGNTNGVKELTKRRVSVPLSDIGVPLHSYYSASPNFIGSGINADINYAINMFTSVEGLQNDLSPTLGYYYMGDVTFTLSRKIKLGPIGTGSNSLVMHVTGLGGFFATTRTTGIISRSGRCVSESRQVWGSSGMTTFFSGIKIGSPTSFSARRFRSRHRGC